MTSCPIHIDYPSLESSENPYPQYEWLRTGAPVYRVPGTSDFLVTRFEDAARIAKDWKNFSSRGSRSQHNPFNETGDESAASETHSMIEADPPDHRDKRDWAANAFKPSRLSAQVPVITQISNSLIDKFAGKGVVEIVSEFAEELPLLVMAEFLGLSNEDLSWMSGWSKVDSGGLSFLPKEVQDRQRQDAKRATSQLERIILSRQNEPGDDELSAMILRHIDGAGEFQLDYVRDNLVTLIRGGVITTAHLISAATLFLLEHPDWREAARADTSWVPLIVEESLRAESPVQWTPRQAVADVEVGGTLIPRGSRVLIIWGSANRDESQFPRPESFAPDRENVSSQAAFGLGPHFCLGAPLARLEARIALETLLARLADWRLAPAQDLSHMLSAQFRGLKHLRFEFSEAPVS